MNEPLSCGRTLADVAQNLGHLPDAHEIQCRWCKLARKGLANRESELRTAYLGAPGLRPSFFEKTGKAATKTARTTKQYRIPGDTPGTVAETTRLELAQFVRGHLAGASGFAPVHISVQPTDQGEPHTRWHLEISIGLYPHGKWTESFAVIDTAMRELGRHLRAEYLHWDLKVEGVLDEG
jgi:hypothetical protein